MTDTMNQAPAIPPGALFDVPGVASQTQWFEDTYETTQNLAVTFGQGTQTNVNGIQQFKQTDIVTDWFLELNITYSFTAAASKTLTPSPYAPHNFIGAFLLNVQNQYNSLNTQAAVGSGIDIYIFNLLRPTFEYNTTNLLGFAPSGDFVGSTALGYPSASNAQPNLLAGGTNAQFPPTTSTLTAATASGTFTLFYRIPASQVFDVYYNLIGSPGANTGSWDGSAPHQAYVSPQYMAGTARVITPQLTLSPLLALGADAAPYTLAAGDVTSTATATGSLTFKRRGVFATNSPLTAPSPYNWQYAQQNVKLQINGTTGAQLIVPQNAGQVIGLFVRMFDPVANAPIQLSALTNIQLQFGRPCFASSHPAGVAELVVPTGHRVLLPPGVFAFDLALDEHMNINNKRALNTLTTTGIIVALTFASATSSQPTP